MAHDHCLGGFMDWEKFFALSVAKIGKTGEVSFFETRLQPPTDFQMHDLIISRFDHLNLSMVEKKKLSLSMRKIILCHSLFETQHFKHACSEFKRKIEQSPEKEFVFKTQGGGIYLFLYLAKHLKNTNKKITCYTSELPLPIMNAKKNPHLHIIYQPHAKSYLSDFSTLWKESEVMSLFELKDYKASA